MLAEQKLSSYNKRKLSSIPAPLEQDSDSDFAPGAFIIEPTKKGKGKRTTATSLTAGSRKRRRGETFDGTSLSGGASKGKARRSLAIGTQEPNPLLQYFEKDLDLHSESEDENEKGTNKKDVQKMEDEPSGGELDREASETAPVLKTWAGLASQAKRSILKGKQKAVEEDSVTESDSEEDTSTTQRLPAFNDGNGAQERPADEDDSLTENDSDEMATLPVKPLKLPKDHQRKKHAAAETDSETEPDSESELLATPQLKPRPGFPLAPNQHYEPPLVLDKEEGISVPAAINTYLRHYQREGVQFFWRQYKGGRGGLLGDDMGLVSKTIQVISFLSAIMKKDGLITDKDRRRKHVSRLQDRSAWKKRRELPPANATWPTCLIIAPSTVVHNWEREFETWGYFEVGLYNGTPSERELVLRNFKMGRLDVLLTTFDLARRDIDKLDDLALSCIIVDEVHRVKNFTSKITMAYHQFECTRRFGLTGTTIQNSYKEMWTILDWTNPGRLGTARQWQGFVVKPLTNGQSAGCSEEERGKSLMVALVLKNKLLPNFFLRRTKDIIKDQLPKKTDQVVFCPLSAKQVEAYKRLLDLPAVQNLVHREDRCPCGSGELRKNCCHPFSAGDVFKYMSILIKLSNHLALILPGPNDTHEQTMRNRALADMAFPEGNIPKYGTAMMQPQYCGKWAVLELLLKEWRKDRSNKVLIFTKSVKLLDMLDFHLKTKGYGFLKLEGSTKQADRMPMIDKFHLDPDVFIFLISTLAGGTGLNLTGANKVVIFDPNWNPAHDLQAMDRAFRFGQTRDVSVYRLLGAGSVEELIYARQIYKQQQMAIGYDASVQTRYFEGIQGDTSKKGELFGIENIFKLHEDKLATKMAIEKANLAELDWALAHMGGGRTKRANKELIDADAKVGKEEGYLRGLGALLFDDTPPQADGREQDMIQKTLNAVGVKYSHMNDEILQPSKIEEERTKKTILKKRQKKLKPDGEPSGPQWPPRRKHHKPPVPPEEIMASRQKALVQLGMISHPNDVPQFARDFARHSKDEQEAIIAELDEWNRNHPQELESESD